MYLYMATKLVQALVIYKSMPADQLAMANTEIDLNEIPEGQVRPNLYSVMSWTPVFLI